MARKIARLTVTPVLSVKGADRAIAWYRRAFDAIEEARFLGADGKIFHARIRLGDSIIHLGEAAAAGETSAVLHLRAPDCDALFRRAVGAGAVVSLPLADQFWADRLGAVRDPFGQTWVIATRVKDLAARKRGVTFETARQIATALPGVAEGPCYGTPGFRVRKKLFARFLGDGDTLVVKTEAKARAQLLRDQPSTYFLTDHYRAHPWVLMRLSGATERELKLRLGDAWRRTAPPSLVAAHQRQRGKGGGG
jgi:uncharacterized glyoxalase superfamily protein PhnB